MASNHNPGDGSWTVTGTGSKNGGQVMTLEIDGDHITKSPLGALTYQDPPGLFVGDEDSTVIIRFLTDGVAYVICNQPGSQSPSGHPTTYAPTSP